MNNVSSGEHSLPSYMRKIIDSKSSAYPLGIYSVCSSNQFVLEACIKISSQAGSPLLIESTCNQVNQFGGYTGMNPEKFVKYVKNLAEKNRLSENSYFLGGDHLGPSVWRNLTSKQALENSIQMIKEYIRAGYKKIHIDTSMGCLDDPDPLPPDIIYERGAILCASAVEECRLTGVDLSDICFVVGTEVPTPGGVVNAGMEIEASTVEETTENINRTRQVFIDHGLEKAWQQTFAFVVQPGVEFDNSTIHPYDRNKAKGLSKLIKTYKNLIYEAHSTDYQTRKHLRMMVEDHYAILKVGPGLTFAMREALMSLESIEKELFSKSRDSLSNLGLILEKVMNDNPEHWASHYSSKPELAAYQRKYSFLDRSRYYWKNSEVEKSLRHLINNLTTQTIPLSLLSQHFPIQYMKVRLGKIQNTPHQLIISKITDILADYIFAIGM